MILAQKGKLRKTFSQLTWDNLGENKNGWEQIDSNITVSAVKKVPPPTGTAEKKDAPKENIVVDNIADKKEDIKVEDNKTEGSDLSNKLDEFIEKQKADFNAVAKEGGLTKNQLKDYFDSEEVNVAYKTNDSLDVLIGLLFENLNGDIELLKTKFSI